MNKQKLALLAALIVLVLAVIWSVMSFPRYKTVAPGASASGKTVPAVRAREGVKTIQPRTTTSAAKTPGSSDDRVLRLDLLGREQSGFKGYRRNIFKPIFVDEIKMMKQKAMAVKPLPIPPVNVVAVKPVPAAQPVAKPEAQPETLQSTLAKFTFLGYLQKDNRKTVFLSKDKEIILVKAGDIFAKRYEATSITEKALSIRVTDTKEEIIIPLYENKPLAAALK